MSVGRNDPCPCGSGEKYKKCCLIKSAPSTNELFWQRLHRERNELIGLILKHIGQVYGPSAINEAWDEFHQWSNTDGFDPDSPEIQLFMPWFFYDWTPDENDTAVFETAPFDLAPALSFLKSKGSRLSELQREYIELCSLTGCSFYEILEVWPGKGFKTKDVLTDELNEVIEKQGSMGANPGQLLFGKAVTIQGLTTFEASSSTRIPPIYKIQVLELKKHLHKLNPVISRDTLWEYDSEIQSLYQSIYNAVTKPQMPTLHNTDGDLLIPHKLTYTLSVSPEDALNALADLNCSESKQEILEYADFENGSLKKVGFPWIKKGNSKHAAMENTVLGHIEIDGSKMTVNLNSENRANEFESQMRERLDGGYKLNHRVIESVEQGFKSKGHKTSLSQTEQDELMNHPEVQAKIAQMMRSHWDGWIHSKIPALGDITPIEAAKTKDGREALEALLTQFELDSERKPQPGTGPEVFQDIRNKLGM